jgi:hypothetical protein
MATGMVGGPEQRAGQAPTASVAAQSAAGRQRAAMFPAAARPRGAGAGNGPARYLADHPLAYALSLAGSGGTALYALAVAARPGHRHRVMWLVLGAHCAAQFAGIMAATELARRWARAGRQDQHRQ